MVASVIGTSMLAAGCGDLGGASGSGDDWDLRVATPLTAQEDQPQAIDQWAEDVEEATDGSISVDTFHGGQLLATEEVLAGLKDGRTDVGYLADAFYPKELPLWNVSSIPFVTLDPFAQAAALEEMYETNDAFAAEFENAGVHILAFLPTPSGAIASPDPIVDFDELSGKRLRAYGYWAQAIKMVGATPTFITTTEAFESMERGVVDGIAGQGIEPMVDRGMIEAAPNLLQTNMGMYVGVSLAISLDTWREMPANVQKVLQSAADNISETLRVRYAERQAEYCQGVQEAGGTVTVLSDEKTAKWKADSFDSLVDSWRSDAVDAGVDERTASDFWDAYLASVAKHEGDVEYEDLLTQCARRGAE